MSSIFDEGNFEEPFYFDMALVENDNQRHLRERYDSLVERNRLDIVCFDPNETQAHHRVKFRTGDKEIEEAEPQLNALLTLDMLRQAGLDVPIDSDDPRLITDLPYTDGVRSVIFAITREDGSLVPVYYETDKDGISPKRLYLMSFDKAQDTVLFYRNLIEYRTQLCEKLRIGDRVLQRLGIDDLMGFNTTLDDIREL